LFKKFSALIIFFVVLITIIFGYQSSKVRMSYDFDKFFPKGDQDLEFYNDFLNYFESDNDFLLVGMTNKDGSVFDTTFLSKVHKFTKEVKKIENIEFSESVTNMDVYYVSHSMGKIRGVHKSKVLEAKKPQDFLSDSIRISRERDFSGPFSLKVVHHLIYTLKTFQ